MSIRLAFLFALGLLLPGGATFAQQILPHPRLDAVLPFSAQAGQSAEVTVAGDAIEGLQQQLVFSHPSIKAEPVMSTPDRFYPEARPVENRFKVTVGADVPPGYHEVRLANRLGVSNARTFVIGDQPESMEKEPNNKPEEATEIKVNSAVSGVCDERGYDRYRFKATKGQRLIIHCTARRADSLADATLVLTDAAGTLLARAHDAVRLDPTIDFTAPADGEYVVSVNDFVFGGGPNHVYRLSVSTGPWIEYIDPPFAAPGAAGQHTVYGRNLPGGTPAEGVKGADGRPLEKLAVTIQAPAAADKAEPAVDTVMKPEDGSIDSFSYRLAGSPGGGGFSNPVRLALVAGGLTGEQEPANNDPAKPQALTMPARVVGRFYPRGDQDWTSFQAKKGDRVWIDVLSQRLGLPTDPFFVVQQVTTGKDGKEVVKDVAEVDDQPRMTQNIEDVRYKAAAEDPAVLFTAPEDATYRVLVRDLYASGQGEPRFFYLLTVRPAEPGFNLVAFVARPTNEAAYASANVLRRGGSLAIDVLAYRRDGFDGPVELSVVLPQPPPAGVTAPPAVMSPAADFGALVLQATPDAAVWTGPIQVVGTATINGQKVTRTARAAETTTFTPQQGGPQRPPLRLVRQLTLAVRDDYAYPLSATAGDGKVLRMARGGKVQVPVTVKATGTPNTATFRPQIPVPQVRAPELAVDASAPKVLDVEIDGEAPLGPMSFILRGEVTAQSARSPELAARADEDQKRITALAAQIQQDMQKAQQARQQAEQMLQQATAQANQAEAQRAQAEQQSNQAAEVEKQAAAKAAETKAAADAAAAKAKEAADAAAKAQADAAADAAAKQAAAQAAAQAQQTATQATATYTAAMEAATQAATQAKTMADALAKAVTAKAEMDEKAKAAATARDEAVKAAEKAVADNQAAQQAQQAAQQRARETAQIAQPKDVRYLVHTTPVTIEVVPAPFTIAFQPAEVTLKAGGDPVDLAATVTREFAFAGDIKFEAQPPQGVAGVAFVDMANVVPGAQNTGALKLKAEANAQPGTHAVRIRMRYPFNNREMVFEQPMQVTVLAPDPPKK